jgi:retron-type reverse transcriptase
VPPLLCSDYRALDTCFRARPIGTLRTLARMLRWPGCHQAAAELQHVANQATSLYRVAGAKRKPDGSVRYVFDAKFPLKTIQGRIQCMILRTVNFPEYLQGSLKNRGQASNARRHVGQRLVITEDVQNFFPATSAKVIFDIWHQFFRFPPEVAECLTKLTTKDGSLPQGAKTSPLLANIVFWQRERDFVLELRQRGIVYTRLVDDITCSASRDLSQGEIGWVIRKLRHMTESFGFRLKRKKETIARASSRMVATKLVINVRLSLPAERRSQIRAAVNSCVASESKSGCVSDKTFNRASGQLAYLAQYHPAEGKALRQALRNVPRRPFRAEGKTHHAAANAG